MGHLDVIAKLSEENERLRKEIEELKKKIKKLEDKDKPKPERKLLEV